MSNSLRLVVISLVGVLIIVSATTNENMHQKNIKIV